MCIGKLYIILTFNLIIIYLLNNFNNTYFINIKFIYIYICFYLLIIYTAVILKVNIII